MGDLILEGVRATTRFANPCENETDLFQALMTEVATLPVTTICHVPCSVRALLAQVLAAEFNHAIRHRLWGFARIFIFAKAVLRAPARGGKKKRHVVSDAIKSRLHLWQTDDITSLWIDARRDAKKQSQNRKKTSLSQNNARRALFFAQEGRFRDAMRSLGSHSCASDDDVKVLEEMKLRHPVSDLPKWCNDVSPPLCVTSTSVLDALKCFTRASSPGFSKLRAQHLLDAVIGSTAPAGQECLENLTRWICFALSGKVDKRVAPWLSGAPLTALYKKACGGVRPIAVGEILRRVISRVCCAAVKPRLPEIFLPYGQIGVGISGGLEAAIHSMSSFISSNVNDPTLCCLNVDMSNAFNNCHRECCLQRLHQELPELYGRVQRCYHTAGDLRFGRQKLQSTTGVQQGDPLGPLLFSLVILELLDDIGPFPNLNFQLWYLDDGTLVGPRNVVASIFEMLQ